jgi:predicted nucleic acid-binding protein
LRAAIIDSSPLLALGALGRAERLASYFDVILVPMRVQREVCRRRSFKGTLKRLYGSGLYRRCPVADRTRVDLLCVDLDPGEAEAITQAQDREVPVFIVDERKARRFAANVGLHCLGAVRLLARMCLEEDGSAERARHLCAELEADLQYRVAPEVINRAISMADLPLVPAHGTAFPRRARRFPLQR